ncbi:MAG: hemerythrin domain-containing protein, partial [Verrucomicrobiia bacterium]
DLNVPIARLCRNAPERLRVLEDLGLVGKSDPNQSLKEACRTHGLEPHTVARMLTAFEKVNRRVQAVAVELMTLTDLCDYLDNVQHVYLRRELTELDRLIRSTVERDGADNSRLLKLQKTFVAFREKLASHLREEAEALFPLIRRLAGGASRRIRLRHSIKIPAIRMEIQHFEVDEGLAELRALAGDCAGSASMSPRTRTLGRVIARFEQRFQELIYEENRILFPRALAISRA